MTPPMAPREKVASLKTNDPTNPAHRLARDLQAQRYASLEARDDMADVLLERESLLAENAALRAERDQISGESIWWKGVIGDGPHQPSGEVRSIKHLHPAMVRPIYEANKGTAVADVIAGLIFSLSITQNREQFLVAYANERRAEAERKLAEAVGLLRRIDRTYADMQDGNGNHPTELRKIRTFLSKEAERG